jgi:holliday junction DNA helicase RuvA
MIGFLKGRLVAKKPPSVLVDVGGVGYELESPMSTFFDLPDVGETLTLYTHLAIREDAHNLYGFLTESERVLFRTLIRVNGIGAKLALAILSSMTVDVFHRCVENQDVQSLTRLPGIGKKTAERLIIELRDRMPELGGAAGSDQAKVRTMVASPLDEALSALVSLGFKPQDAQAMIKPLDTEGLTSEDIIRLALKAVAR